MSLTLKSLREKLVRFAHKSPSDRREAVSATLRVINEQAASAPHRTWAALNQRYRRRQIFGDVIAKTYGVLTRLRIFFQASVHEVKP
jgi:hypothetical protein